MNVSRCRHTFTQDKALLSWQRCGLCLLAFLPFASVRRCSSCDCTLHEECYAELMRELGRLADAVEGRNSNVDQSTSAADHGAEPEAKAEGAVSPSSRAQQSQQQATSPLTEGARNFGAYLERQRAALIKTFTSKESSSSSSPATTATQEQRQGESGTQAPSGDDSCGPATASASMDSFLTFFAPSQWTVPAASPTSTTGATTADGEASARLASLSVGGGGGAESPAALAAAASSPLLWRWVTSSSSSPPPLFSADGKEENKNDDEITEALATDRTTMSKTEAINPHVHSFFPTIFYAPTRCVQCMARKASSSPPNAAIVLKAPEALADPTSTNAAEILSFIAEGSSTPATGQTRSVPATSIMGLGTEGYQCLHCACALHRGCLHELPHDTYNIVAPRAKEMQGQSASLLSSSPPKNTTAAMDAFQQFISSISGQGQSAQMSSSSSSSFLNTSAASLLTSYTSAATLKALISAYLNAGGRHSQSDPNVGKILDGLFGLLDVFMDRHPDIVPKLLNPINMHDLSQQHQKLYSACCELLPDASFFTEADEGETVTAAAATTAGNTNGAVRGSHGSLGPEREDLSSHPVMILLRDSLRFAIAVYGETYRKGLLSSFYTSALVFTVNKNSASHTPKQNDRAVTDVLTLPHTALKASRWSSRPTEPSYALLIDHVTQRIVMAFRGTLSDTDILTDVCAFDEPFCGGVAHQGAAQTVNSLFVNRASTLAAAAGSTSRNSEDAAADVRDADAAEKGVESSDASAAVCAVLRSPRKQSTLDDPVADRVESYTPALEVRQVPDHAIDTLVKLVMNHPSYQVTITGHSLGGGVAVLFGVRLFYDKIFPADVYKRIRVISFAPMPTLSLPAAAICDEAKMAGMRIWSVVNGCDLVPRLQVNSLDRLCKAVCASGKTTNAKADGGAGDASVEGRRSSTTVTGDATAQETDDLPNSASDASSIDPLLEKQQQEHCESATEKPSLPDRDLTTELHHPGRVFMLTTPWDSTTNRLVEVPRGHLVMHDIFLMRPMVALHMMDNYTEGLKRVVSKRKKEGENGMSTASILL